MKTANTDHQENHSQLVEWIPILFHVRYSGEIHSGDGQGLKLFPPETGWDLNPGILCCSACTWTSGLLQQQKTKKLKGTKTSCVPTQLGHIISDEIQKDQKLSRSRVLACTPYRAPPRGWADHLSDPSSLTPGYTPALSPQLSPQEASKGSCYLFSLPWAAAQIPIKPCLNFSSGLLSGTLTSVMRFFNGFQVPSRGTTGYS